MTTTRDKLHHALAVAEGRAEQNDEHGFPLIGSVERANFLIAAVKELLAEGEPWAICQGGLIQDASADVETTDLDWMEDNGPAELDEVERSWRLLNRVVNEAGRVGWADELHEVEEWLTSIYKDQNTDEDRKVWNE